MGSAMLTLDRVLRSFYRLCKM